MVLFSSLGEGTVFDALLAAPDVSKLTGLSLNKHCLHCYRVILRRRRHSGGGDGEPRRSPQQAGAFSRQGLVDNNGVVEYVQAVVAGHALDFSSDWVVDVMVVQEPSPNLFSQYVAS